VRSLSKVHRRAKTLRAHLSLPEGLPWSRLRRLRRQEGPTFRRQHPVGPYILDFYCAEKRLAIEVDGEAHSVGDNPQRDARRDAFLKSRGVRVLRFSAEHVFREMNGVVLTILDELSR